MVVVLPPVASLGPDRALLRWGLAAAEIDVGLPLLEVLVLEFLEVKILAGLWSERSKQEVQSEKSWKSLQLGLIKGEGLSHLWLVRKTSGRCFNNSDWAIWWLRLRVGSWKFLSVKRCTWLQCLVSSTLATLGKTKKKSCVKEWGRSVKIKQRKETKQKGKKTYSLQIITSSNSLHRFFFF